MNRIRTLLAVVAVVVVGAAVVSAADLHDAATVSRPARRVSPPDRVLVVSDSAWLGIKTYGAVDAVQGFDHTMDLASCRRRVSTSCRNYDGHVPITLLDELRLRGDDYSTLLVLTGYNDSDHDFRDDLDLIVGQARAFGYQRVVWSTLRSNVSYTSPGNAGYAAVFERNNATLRELAGSSEYPDLVVADWAVYAADQHHWFAPDGIHVRVTGPWAAADYLSRKLAYLDVRACPNPTAPGRVVQDPCPDPDASPPDVDLAGLYPIGAPNPTAGFQMEWQGSSSWPAPPWWER